MINIANLISLFRIVAMIPVSLLLLSPTPSKIVVAAVIILLSTLSDAIDGTVARKLHQTSLFGARFDIYADRIQDICLWSIFSALGIFPSIMVVLFVVRGLLTDAIREHALLSHNQTPFEFTKNSFGDFFVSTRWSRLFNGFLKLSSFLLAAFTLLNPSLLPITLVFGWSATIFNLIRGLPVLLKSGEILRSDSR